MKTPNKNIPDTKPPSHTDQEPPGGEKTVMQILPRWKINPAAVLRWGGGIVFAAAAITFMFQGLYSFDPMLRHWFMLALCSLLGVLGICTGTLLKEEKGARVFLGFAAACFPVLASQLGAMLFSVFGKPPIGMPQPLVFSLVNTSKITAVTALTLAITLPASYLAFKVLARSKTNLLTWLYTLANLCILIPVRDTSSLYAIVLLLTGTLLWADSRRLHKDFLLNNFEGRISRCILFIPLLVILARSLFYPLDASLYGLTLVLAGGYLAFFWGTIAEKRGTRIACQLSGQAVVITGWFTCLASIVSSVQLGTAMTVYVALLPAALSLGAQSFFTDTATAKQYRYTSAAVILLSVIAAHWCGATPMVSVLGVLLGLLTLAAGTLAGEKTLFAQGSMAVLIGLGNFGYQAVRLHNDYAWFALAIVGIAVMFSASLFEKKHTLSLFRNSTLWGKLKTR